MGQYCDTIWGRRMVFRHRISSSLFIRVFYKDFYIDTVEVTQGEYDSLMKATYPGYSKPAWSVPTGKVQTIPHIRFLG